MREGRRSPARRQARSDRPPRRTARSQARSDRPPRRLARSPDRSSRQRARSPARSDRPPRRRAPVTSPVNRLPRRIRPVQTGRVAGASRALYRRSGASARSPPGPGPGFDRIVRSMTRSTGRPTGRLRLCFDQFRSGSVFHVTFRPLVVLNPYISAQDAPKLGLDHV